MHPVQSLNTDRGFLGDALDLAESLRVPLRIHLELGLDGAEEALFLLAAGVASASRFVSALAPKCSSIVASPPSSKIMLL